MQKPKIVVIVGPTASGKTSLSIEIAKKFDGEIISADSRQVYKGLDIGTAKVTEEEMQSVPHHLIDVVDVTTTYSAADFKQDAAAAIADVTARDKLPIIAGGTFFYIDTLLERIQLPNVPPDQELRSYFEDLDSGTLYSQLEKLDPKRALTVDANNKRRLVRALEIAYTAGKVPRPNNAKKESPYNSLMIGIEVDREELRARFRERAAQWLDAGLREEVDGLLAEGVSRDRLREIGFEYTLTLSLVDGEIDEEEFIERYVQKNWQYAKRQMMWLRRDKTIHWFRRDETDKICREVRAFLKN